MAIQGAIFKLRAQIAFKHQDPVYQTSSLIEFRRILVDQMAYKVEQLNRESFEEFEDHPRESARAYEVRSH